MNAVRFRRGSSAGLIDAEDNVLSVDCTWFWGLLPDVHSRF